MAAPSAARVVSVANTLLEHVGVPRSVQSLEQCDSTLFSQLYEALTGTRPPGGGGGGGSEALQCQAVVDALSGQLTPHISLEHIHGDELAARDLLSITNLLDIFSVLFHLPSPVEGSSPPMPPQGADSNLVSSEGLSVVSELIREELGSTDSTADLLQPVPRARLPHLSHFLSRNSSSLTPPHPSPTPSLTITSLTSSSVTSEQPGTVVLGREGESSGRPHQGDGGREDLAPSPPSSPPSTPPLSHRRLLSSPLHHSTPHTSTKSRVFPTHTQTVPPSLASQPPPRPPSFPLTESQAAPSHPTHGLGNPLSAHLLLPAPPATERRESQQEGGGGGRGGGTSTVSRLVQAAVATQTDEVVSGSQSCPQSTPSTAPSTMPLVEQSPPVSTPDQVTRTQDILEPGHEHSSNSSQSSGSPTPKFPPGGPRVHFSSPTTQHRSSKEATPSLERSLEVGRRAAEVRGELLASLYQRYLRELRASQPSQGKGKARTAAGRTRSMATGNKPHDKHSLPGRRGVHRRARPHRQQPHSSHPREEEEEERDGQDKERRKEKRQTLPAEISPGDDLLPLVEGSLPSCLVSPATLRRLWKKQLHQITTLTRHTPSHPHTASKVSEMERKHTALLEAIRKELEHTRRMQRQQEARAQQQAVRSQLLARRHAAARARCYFNEYELRLKAKMQKKRTKEEQIFRKVFEDGLDILQERARELRRFAQEKKSEQSRQHTEQLQSLEQYYKDQFSMLTESLAREKEEVVIRDKAQRTLAQRLRRELRERLEREIQLLQECLDRDEDAAHFRELDAHQLRQSLHQLPFTTSHK